EENDGQVEEADLAPRHGRILPFGRRFPPLLPTILSWEKRLAKVITVTYSGRSRSTRKSPRRRPGRWCQGADRCERRFRLGERRPGGGRPQGQGRGLRLPVWSSLPNQTPCRSCEGGSKRRCSRSRKTSGRRRPPPSP